MTINLDQIGNRIRDFPPLSDSLMAVLRMLNSGDVDFTVLESRIIKEPALATRILSAANSPLYGMSGKMGKLKEACVLLGTNTLRNMVMAIGIIDYLSHGSGNHIDHNKFWKHSIGTGMSARVLAKQFHADKDVAFSAGILHDIGKLVLDIFFAEEYASVVDYRDQNDCLLKEAEDQVLGFNHCEVGAMIAEKWKLPDAITDCIRFHHTPVKTTTSPLVDLIHISDIVCRALEIGNGGDSLIPVIEPQVLERHQLDISDLENQFAEIEQKVELANVLFI
ncbi:MAG: HDOD domain-containing protein [Gammaproteobacteria bacterium]